MDQNLDIINENEKNVLKYHKINNIYKQINELRKDNEKFNFMDGPPFVSSDNLHYGHLLVASIKSSMQNYKRMQGFSVQNKIGYDCHGLPIEMVVNKILGLESKEDVEKYGIANYNKKCKEVINQYSNSWEPIYDKLGRWVDYSNQYKTMDTNFMESVWNVTKRLWDKNYITKGYKVMTVSTKCGTPLSNFEASSNYKEVIDPAVYVKFKIKAEDKYLLVWTTTPWTLPSNLCVCINADSLYVEIQDKNNEIYILAKDGLDNLYGKKDKTYKIIKEFLGKELLGIKYVPLFSYFENTDAFRVLSDNYVEGTKKIDRETNKEKNIAGTGIVHLAPAFGEDDMRVCTENNIVNINNISDFCPINDNGIFTNKTTDLENIYFLDANNIIIKKLKEQQVLIKRENHKHSYPFC